MPDAFKDRNSDDDKWLLAEAETDSGLLFVRLNTTAKAFVGAPSLNIKLGFAIPLQQQTGCDLPDPDENEVLASVEDQICQTVSEGANGIHVLTLTNAVMKEIVFYIEPGADIAAMHKLLTDSVKSHEVQCMAVRDPNWETYLEFSPN
jgi:hypothetical protein